MKKQQIFVLFSKIFTSGVFRAPFSGFGAVSNVMQKQSSGRSTPASIKREKAVSSRAMGVKLTERMRQIFISDNEMGNFSKFSLKSN